MVMLLRYPWVLVLGARGYQKNRFGNQHSYWRSSNSIPKTYSIYSSIAPLAWSADVYNQVFQFRNGDSG